MDAIATSKPVGNFVWITSGGKRVKFPVPRDSAAYSECSFSHASTSDLPPSESGSRKHTAATMKGLPLPMEKKSPDRGNAGTEQLKDFISGLFSGASTRIVIIETQG